MSFQLNGEDFPPLIDPVDKMGIKNFLNNFKFSSNKLANKNVGIKPVTVNTNNAETETIRQSKQILRQKPKAKNVCPVSNIGTCGSSSKYVPKINLNYCLVPDSFTLSLQNSFDVLSISDKKENCHSVKISDTGEIPHGNKDKIPTDYNNRLCKTSDKRTSLHIQAFGKSLTYNTFHKTVAIASLKLFVEKHTGIKKQQHFRDSKCNKFQMLIADIIDKFTNSSTDCFNLLNKFGICVSKQTYERYQTQIVEERKSNSINSSKCQFQIASVDNINKRSSYAAVKSTDAHRGFDGTSIQLVIPKPSIELLPEEKQQYLKGHIYLYGKDEYRSINLFQIMILKKYNGFHKKLSSIAAICTEVMKESEIQQFARNRKRKPEDLHFCNQTILNLDSFVNKVTIEPSNSNRQESNLKKFIVNDFEKSDSEIAVAQSCASTLLEYCFCKLPCPNSHSQSPGIQDFISKKTNNTVIEKSEVKYLSLLDEQCDNKDTVKHSLEILHQNLNVGQDINHLVVVGDGKTYDLLVKLKGEYGSELDWVLLFQVTGTYSKIIKG
ncbi:unnamed protein product [Mytilus edulis]|uniref:Uncharacterized protein n=1 Tax=Mytilus edulis TaxID=6550 RepID=A0A8S3S241_MYTED|nr:unnamed protein product [Mytilus edulis]